MNFQTTESTGQRSLLLEGYQDARRVRKARMLTFLSILGACLLGFILGPLMVLCYWILF